VIELSYANVAGIVVVSALLGGTFAQLGPWFLGWTDRRRDRRPTRGEVVTHVTATWPHVADGLTPEQRSQYDRDLRARIHRAQRRIGDDR
jgi:hypothetical protein